MVLEVRTVSRPTMTAAIRFRWLTWYWNPYASLKGGAWIPYYRSFHPSAFWLPAHEANSA